MGSLRTVNWGLTYRKSADGQETNKLNASVDHAGADGRWSVSGWCVMINDAMMSWASQRQPVTIVTNNDKQDRVRVVLSVSMHCEMRVCAQVMEQIGNIYH